MSAHTAGDALSVMVARLVSGTALAGRTVAEVTAVAASAPDVPDPVSEALRDGWRCGVEDAAGAAS